MTITCPRCGLDFETRATTNTRCRRCRHVVRVGRSPARAAPRQLEESTPDDVTDDEPTADDAFAAIVGLASVAVGVLVLVGPKIVEAVRRWRGTTAPMLASPAPVAGPLLRQAGATDKGTSGAFRAERDRVGQPPTMSDGLEEPPTA